MNILLTGGRAPAALELARAFHAAGYRVYMAESIPAHLSQSSRSIARNFRVPPPRQQPEAYIEVLKAIIIRHSIDLLLPTCEEIFYVAMGLDCLTPHCTVFTEPIERLRTLHHKWLFACRAQAYGLRVPDSMLVETVDDLKHAFDRYDALVLKPAYSRFASKTILRPASYETVAHLAVSPEAPWVAQEFITGRQVCSYSVVHQGRITAHTVYPAEFTAGQGASIAFRHIDHPAILDWVRRFLAAERFTGQIAFDFTETLDGEIAALECNPRTTSGVHLLASRPDFPAVFFNSSAPCITPSSDVGAMLITGMLLYALPFALRRRCFHDWFSTVRSSSDVVFSIHDPLPALLQFQSIAYFMALGRHHQISPLEASTYDIEWNGSLA